MLLQCSNGNVRLGWKLESNTLAYFSAAKEIGEVFVTLSFLYPSTMFVWEAQAYYSRLG